MKRLDLLVLMLLLGACSMAPDYQRPDIATGENWKEGTVVTPEKRIAEDWWTQYGSLDLNALVIKAQMANNDVQASLQRINQARAALRTAGAPLWPQVNASGSGSKTWTDSNGSTVVNDSSSAGLTLSYELDLFGKNRSAADAAEAQLNASQFDHEALKLVVVGDVVKAYASAAAATERLRVANNNLVNSKDVLKIIAARFKEGSASALELSQQKADVASAEASIASLQSGHETYVSQLAVLSGQAPQIFAFTEGTLGTLKAPQVTPVIPSRLLEQRPDIRKAEADLVAANANIGAARAAFFPSLDLGVSGLLTGNPAASILSLSASALAPIFSGGSLEGALENSQARKEELVATYRQTVLTAFKEVTDALAAVKAANTRVAALDTAQTESRKAYKLARARYDSGSIDFQSLLDTQRTLLQAEDTYTQARLEQLGASVDLIKAMGGGWNGRVE